MHNFQKTKSNSFFALLSLPSTAMGFALSIQISALSWILTTQYKLDIHDVGLVWAAGPLAGILGQVIIGVVSDRVWFWNGRRHRGSPDPGPGNQRQFQPNPVPDRRRNR
jgi:MFS family permease